MRRHRAHYDVIALVEAWLYSSLTGAGMYAPRNITMGERKKVTAITFFRFSTVDIEPFVRTRTRQLKSNQWVADFEQKV